MIDKRVLFFGDSLVAGTGDPEGRGWVGRVVEASFKARVPLTTYNLGVRGATSVEVAGRWQAEAAPRLTQGAECRVVFSFGVNDTTIEDGAPRIEPKRSVQSLRAVLDQAALLDLGTLVVGPAPVDDGEQTDRIASISREFADACQQRGVPFFDVLSRLRGSKLWRQEIANDGAHPGAAGYHTLAELILAAGWLNWLD